MSTQSPEMAEMAIHCVTASEWRTLVEQAFREERQRVTPQRQAVLDWIASREGPFRSEELVAAMEAHQGGSRATIYRMIEWLRSRGWIARVQHTVPQHRYACLVPGHSARLVCSTCGTTFAFDVQAWLTAMLADIGFEVHEIHEHILELQGVCAHCRAALSYQ
jgi:Fur family zinc uptake transcriptional regulator